MLGNGVGGVYLDYLDYLGGKREEIELSTIQVNEKMYDNNETNNKTDGYNNEPYNYTTK